MEPTNNEGGEPAVEDERTSAGAPWPLVQAVVGHKDQYALVRLIGPDNEPGELKPLIDAWMNDDTYMVEVAHHLIVLDVDVEKGADWVGQAREALTRLGCRRALAASSGRGPGYRHEYWTLPIAVTQDEAKVAVRDAVKGVPADGLRYGNNRVRPPLSRHRTGSRGQLLNPTDVDTAVKQLRPSARPGYIQVHPDWHAALRSDQSPRLPRKANGGVASTHAILSLAHVYVNAGRTLAQFQTDCGEATAPWIVDKLQRVKPVPVSTFLAERYETARAHIRSEPLADDRRPRINAMKAAAGSYPWKGTTGETDRSVLAQLLHIADDNTMTTVGCSVRTLAERTGYETKTVGRSLQRLRLNKWIGSAETLGGGLANRYTLQLPLQIEVDDHISSCVPPKTNTCVVNDYGFEPRGSLPDIFVHKNGLGKTSHDTWRATPTEWTTTAVIADRRPGGLSAGAVLSHLKKLAAAGLVERQSPRGHTWRRIPHDPVELAALAAEWGMTEALARRYTRFEAERVAFKELGPVRGPVRDVPGRGLGLSYLESHAS